MPTRSSAQVPEHDLKAAFIFNFIQFTTWPEAALKGPTINLCATPGTILYMALEPIARKTIHNRMITLRSLADAPVGACHVIVASASDRERKAHILRLAEPPGVLTITDDTDAIPDGMMIAMGIMGGKISFVVDNALATKHGLTVSSRILRLARSVH